MRSAALPSQRGKYAVRRPAQIAAQVLALLSQPLVAKEQHRDPRQIGQRFDVRAGGLLIDQRGKEGGGIDHHQTRDPGGVIGGNPQADLPAH